MQFCKPHWEALRAAIEKRGLNQFIAENGKQAMEHVVRELKGEDTVVDFEPLMGSHNMLLNAAMHYYNPLFVMGMNEDGSHRCPVCLLASLDWVEWVADGALGEATRRGLVEAPKETGP